MTFTINDVFSMEPNALVRRVEEIATTESLSAAFDAAHLVSAQAGPKDPRTNMVADFCGQQIDKAMASEEGQKGLFAALNVVGESATAGQGYRKGAVNAFKSLMADKCMEDIGEARSTAMYVKATAAVGNPLRDEAISFLINTIDAGTPDELMTLTDSAEELNLNQRKLLMMKIIETTENRTYQRVSLLRDLADNAGFFCPVGEAARDIAHKFSVESLDYIREVLEQEHDISFATDQVTGQLIVLDEVEVANDSRPEILH